MIDVSVIIPIYNAENYLEKTLSSIRNQTLLNIEVICVDDGSTDCSLAIAQNIAKQDKRFVVVTQEKSSAGKARNNGMQFAKGKYLVFLDADDFYERELLEKEYIRAEKTKADVVVVRSDRYDEVLNDYTESFWTIKKEYLPSKEVFSHAEVKRLFNCFVGWAWDKMFRTEFIKQNHLEFQDQKSINDLLFVYSALAKAARISVIDEILVHKRHNAKNSITTNYAKTKEWKCFYNALLELKKQLVIRGLYRELERDYVNYALYFVLWNLYKFRDSEEYVTIYNMVKTVGLEKMGIVDRPKDFFYEHNDYLQLQAIMSMEAREYFNYEKLMRKDGTYLFPFELVGKASRIVIYGAGAVGKSYYRQIMHTAYCEVVAWVDRKYVCKGKEVSNPDIIYERREAFDCIVLAINDKNVANNMKEELVKNGIDVKKVVWRSPEIGI